MDKTLYQAYVFAAFFHRILPDLCIYFDIKYRLESFHFPIFFLQNEARANSEQTNRHGELQ